MSDFDGDGTLSCLPVDVVVLLGAEGVQRNLNLCRHVDRRLSRAVSCSGVSISCDPLASLAGKATLDTADPYTQWRRPAC
jgi:hypothetical protein